MTLSITKMYINIENNNNSEEEKTSKVQERRVEV